MWDGLTRFTPEEAWHADASPRIFSCSMCVCPPICVGLAVGQSDGELESGLWHYIPASYHSDIWPNRTQRG